MTDSECVGYLENVRKMFIIGRGRCEGQALEYQQRFISAIEYAIAKIQTGECRTCRHRDPEDKKCDCGGLERQGCIFPVSDDYFCKFYEKAVQNENSI